jgi:A/G-specific adenine glycosylase
MLQQTQVDRVIPKYRLFLKRFPTLRALARARLGEVLRIWVGLGYNSRARRLWECARAVQRDWNGRLPSRELDLRALPGLGRYSASAVACFAFGARVPVVDTNVRRVLGRALLRRDDVSMEAAWRVAAQALPRDAASWSQALMDIGSRFCRAVPRCEACPARRACAWAAKPPRVSPSSRRSLGTLRTPLVRYEGSRRQQRGRVITSLASVPGLSLIRLGPKVKPDYCESDLPWLRDLLRDLARDGLLVLERNETRARLP